MSVTHAVRPFVLVLCLSATAAVAQTSQTTAPFEPQVGQEGKDVVWVPTPQTVVDKMLDMAKVTPTDYVMDLGSGDGRTVITAAKRGARALGIEYNPDMVKLSKRAAATAKVTAKASFMEADLFTTDFSKATVITMFLLPDINLKLRPELLELRPGTRIVSNTFTMGEWAADETFKVTEDCASYCTALLWIVPAKAAGRWKLPDGELTIKQDFQILTGTLDSGGHKTPITNGKMQGTRITFTAGKTQYTGRVNGRAIDGTITGAAAGGKFHATRAGA